MDLLMNIILQNLSSESLNSVESQRVLANHGYYWALSIAAFSSNVLVPHSCYSRHLIEASAWVPFFGLIRRGSLHGKTSQEYLKHLQPAPTLIFTSPWRTLTYGPKNSHA